MAKHKDEEPDKDPAADPSGGEGGDKPNFPVHEHIGRTLKSLFDEVESQPIPEKLRELLEKLEQKKEKDS
jgi:hypothetical protein